jgi:uncharacterized damage-inducible protein DinB
MCFFDGEMKAFFTGLFEYNYYCNQRLSAVFMEAPLNSGEKSGQLFSHMLNAHQIWNFRIAGKKDPRRVWEDCDAGDFMQTDQGNYHDTLSILNGFDLNDTVQYSNTKGQRFNNKIGDILFHVINHSTYHRGQIALDFRKNGREPLATDYIFYKRPLE